jgi:CheY-like chemotaxis protein
LALFGRKKKRKQTVLIVDDDADLRATVEMRFSMAGFEVLQAGSGEEGLKLAAKSRPAAVILDVNMPGIDGYETCRRLRASRKTRDIPVIMLTACTRIGELEEGLRAGADTYLTKPFDGPELVEEVREVLSGRSGGGRAGSEVEGLTGEVVAKLRAAPRKLGDVARAVPGVLLGRGDELLLSDERGSEQHRSLLVETDVEPLATRRPRKFLKFSERVAQALCPDASVFDLPRKVLVRRKAPPLVAALDTQKRLVDKTVICVVPKERKAKPEFLLGFLASRVATFALENAIERVRGGVLPWVSPAELERLPIPGSGGLSGRDFEDRLADLAGDLAKRADAGMISGAQATQEALDKLDRIVAEGFELGGEHLKILVSPPTS